jgi:predicted transcriptional regulator
MRQENVIVFTEKEVELVNLLFEIGIKRNVAKVLVYLTKTPTVTSRAIDRGTDLRHLEVATVMQYLKKQGWIKSQENKAKSRGRPVKIYELAKPIADIVNGIEKEKIKEANDQFQLIQKLRNYVSKSHDPALFFSPRQQ